MSGEFPSSSTVCQNCRRDGIWWHHLLDDLDIIEMKSDFNLYSFAVLEHSPSCHHLPPPGDNAPSSTIMNLISSQQLGGIKNNNKNTDYCLFQTCLLNTGINNNCFRRGYNYVKYISVQVLRVSDTYSNYGL